MTSETRNTAHQTGKDLQSFFLVSVCAFLLTTLILLGFDLVPEVSEPKVSSVTPVAEARTEAVRLDPNPEIEENAMPERIVADSVGLDVRVLNPLETSIAALDAALLGGAVRYPGSASLGDEENMLIFGHSSALPVVRNKAFQAFNGIKDLKTGEIIRVYSKEREYLYEVESVSHVAAADAQIPLQTGEKRLTLSTCDSFGKKTDRYVVEARFVGSYPIER